MNICVVCGDKSDNNFCGSKCAKIYNKEMKQKEIREKNLSSNQLKTISQSQENNMEWICW